MFMLFDGLHKVDSAKTKGGISDGDHTFDELYDHRCLLFLMCMKSQPEKSWFSDKHDDSDKLKGWFLCGIDLPTGTITYHLPDSMKVLAKKSGATELARGKKWDGHTSKDVIKRLTEYMENF